VRELVEELNGDDHGDDHRICDDGTVEHGIVGGEEHGQRSRRDREYDHDRVYHLGDG
jgi:hypothetical protein